MKKCEQYYLNFFIYCRPFTWWQNLLFSKKYPNSRLHHSYCLPFMYWRPHKQNQQKTFTCSAKLAKYNQLRYSDLCSKNYQIVKVQRSKYWGQPLLLLTAGEIEPTLSSEKFERQTNFPAIKSSAAGKRSLLYKILHQQRDPQPKYPMLLFVHIKEIQYRKLHLPSLSRQCIHYDYKQKNDKVLILLR